MGDGERAGQQSPVIIKACVVIDLATTEKQFVNAVEVMELFGVSRRTVYYWVEHGHVEGVVIGGTIRISVASLRLRRRPIKTASVQSAQSRLHSA